MYVQKTTFKRSNTKQISSYKMKFNSCAQKKNNNNHATISSGNSKNICSRSHKIIDNKVWIFFSGAIRAQPPKRSGLKSGRTSDLYVCVCFFFADTVAVVVTEFVFVVHEFFFCTFRRVILKVYGFDTIRLFRL